MKVRWQLHCHYGNDFPARNWLTCHNELGMIEIMIRNRDVSLLRNPQDNGELSIVRRGWNGAVVIIPEKNCQSELVW